MKFDHTQVVLNQFNLVRQGCDIISTVRLPASAGIDIIEVAVHTIGGAPLCIRHFGIHDVLNLIAVHFGIALKIRYKDSGSLSTIFPDQDGVRVQFYEDAKGVAPGQSAVFYEGDDVIAGGIILRS